MCGYKFFKSANGACTKCPREMFSIDFQGECFPCSDPSILSNSKYTDFMRAKFKALCNAYQVSEIGVSGLSTITLMIALIVCIFILSIILIILLVFIRKRGLSWVCSVLCCRECSRP